MVSRTRGPSHRPGHWVRRRAWWCGRWYDRAVQPIPVHYNKALGVVILCAGLFVGGTGLLVVKPLLIGLGLLQTLIGLGYVTRPVAMVFEDRVEMKNLLGMTMRTHDVPKRDLQVRDGKVYKKGNRTALFGGFLAHQPDIAALKQSL